MFVTSFKLYCLFPFSPKLRRHSVGLPLADPGTRERAVRRKDL